MCGSRVAWLFMGNIVAGVSRCTQPQTGHMSQVEQGVSLGNERASLIVHAELVRLHRRELSSCCWTPPDFKSFRGRLSDIAEDLCLTLQAEKFGGRVLVAHESQVQGHYGELFDTWEVITSSDQVRRRLAR